MRIVFFGTPAFAAGVLRSLLEQGQEVVAVVTRPDRPRGRSLQLSASAVKETLLQLKPMLPLYQPEKASTPEFASLLSSLRPDLFVVVAYGEIIKQHLLDVPTRGAINIHTSLLPKYRGAAPMQRCLMDGVTETGISIIEMVLQMDAGDILDQRRLAVPQEMTCGELEEQFLPLACQSVLSVIQEIGAGQVRRVPQDPALVSFAPKIQASEERIDWKRSARELHNLIRALSPFPGAWTSVHSAGTQKRLKIKRSLVVEEKRGEIGSLHLEHNHLVVACGTGSLRLTEVQLEGKKTLSDTEFLRGLSASNSFSIDVL